MYFASQLSAEFHSAYSTASADRSYWNYTYKPEHRGAFHHHHHHDVRLARISLTLSLHVSLSFIAFGRSSGLHPVSSHSCCMNVRAGRLAFDWPYAAVHRSTSLMISSLLLRQCLAVSGMSGSSSLYSFRDRW